MIVLIFFVTVFLISVAFFIGLWFLGHGIRFYVNIKEWISNRKQNKYIGWLKKTDKEVKKMLK